MSKLRVNPFLAEDRAKDDFRREVRIRRVHLDMRQFELADDMGIVPSVMTGYLAEPDKIPVGRLRKMNRVLDMDPLILLALIGYTDKDIQKLKKRLMAESA